MLDEAEYASDTDDSDDDYKPGADGSDVSEAESDGEPENDVENQPKGKKRSANVEEVPSVSKRNKRTEEETKSPEKVVLDDEEDIDEDALWASFLSKTDQSTGIKTETAKSKEPSQKAASSSNGSSMQTTKNTPKAPVRTEPKKVVTEIFEFAGEKIEVKKEVKATEEKPSVLSGTEVKKTVGKPGPALPFGRPRSSGGGGSSGLSSVLGQIGKKNKLSVLEKSKLDWTGFKQSEGIDEELQTHNKGRDGYLERQDFLQRTDLRQFEIEKSMRAANRKKL